MKTDKLIFYSIALSACISGVSAQIIHEDLNPDVVMPMPMGSDNSIKLDIDGDNSDDVEFFYTNYPSFNIWNLGVVQVDTNNPKIEILYDNSMPASPVGDYYVKQLSQNNLISNSLYYTDHYPQIGDIYYGNFNGQTGKYIGFRLKSGASDFKYGWIAVEFTGSGDMTFTIKEYAYQNSINTDIKAGQTSSVGIENPGLQSAGIIWYPNPAIDHIRISNSNESIPDQVSIYSVQGKRIKNWSIHQLPIDLDIKDLNRGTFFLEVIENNQAFREIFIKK